MILSGSNFKKLKLEIEAKIVDYWFFPTGEEFKDRLPGNKVQGFLGTGPIMLVSERPSTGNFCGPADRLLYNLLDQYGAADAHLTDVIKSRGKVGERYPDDMREHRRIFDREIEIVRPRLIITFGRKVYDLLQFSLAGYRIKIKQVWHYSYTRRGADKVAGFKQQLAEALKSA